jgi:hypothetical protein
MRLRVIPGTPQGPESMQSISLFDEDGNALNVASLQGEPGPQGDPGPAGPAGPGVDGGPALPDVGTFPEGGQFLNTVEFGGKLYGKIDGAWQAITPGLLYAPRGLIGQNKIIVPVPSTAIAVNAHSDIPGATCTFDFTGRPVSLQGIMSWMQVSIIDCPLTLTVTDVAAAKDVWATGFKGPGGAVVSGFTQFFEGLVNVPPTTEFADGTAIPVGSRTWKIRLQNRNSGGGINYKTTWAEDTNFQGAISVFEV